MKEYERIQHERESRINRARLSRALYEYIGGAWSKPQSKPELISPTVKRLAEMLHYDAAQLVTDIKDMYAANTDSFRYGDLLDRITARYNAEVDQNRRAGELDFIPDEHSAADILNIIISEYALRHFPDLLHDNENY